MLVPCQLRADVRRRWNMPEDACGDCCATFCCPACAIGQHTIEIRNRLRAEQAQGGMMVNGVVQVPVVQAEVVGQPQQPVVAKAVVVGQPNQADMQR